jgi:O-antigen/teichoic acid export membrane protein
MHDVVRRVLEGLVALTTPVALLLALGADLWVRLAFGPAYAPAAGVLRTLAPLFVVVYLSILFSMALVVEGRGWLLTAISLAGIATGAGMALLLVPRLDALGPGGAATGMALASVAKELLVLSLLTFALGRHLLDRRRFSVCARTALAAFAGIGAHLALAPLGHLRLPLDVAAYALAAVALGVLDPRAIARLLRELRRPQ